MDLNELEMLALAATPGPWYWEYQYSDSGLPCVTVSSAIHGENVVSESGLMGVDADFIAAANPAVVLELIAEIRKLKGSI